ncbi:MAG: sugar ABC transporter ATP-binding protein [Cyanobacteria bacterium]|nr:sugar ABC transporter ATP-binding protein [Cyanobacteriota bacterium]
MLKIRNISKTFPGVKALDHINLDIYEGEVHAIVGENGAGKSTLMNLIMGIFLPDEGEFFLNEKRVFINNPNKALELGINMIFQEINLIPTLSVAENIFSGRLPKIKNSPLVDWKKLKKDTEKILEQLCFDIKPIEKVSNLTTGQKQLIQVAKAISSDSNIIIMDEPTASLSNKETEQLFNIIRNLKKGNKSIIYISHRLEEVFEIADKITVLRDGKLIDTLLKKDATKEKLISLMVGRYVKEMYKEKKHIITDTILSINNFNKSGLFKDVSFELKKGEILGIYGLIGAGRTELALSIFGILAVDSGKLFLYGNELKIQNPVQAIQNGIGYLPEERKEQSILPLMNIKENITISNLKKYCNFIFINDNKERVVAEQYVKMLNIKTPFITQKLMNLSGGNQQKVTIARLLALAPKILILDEPTKGIDVGTKAEIHAIIEELAKNGIGIIVISSELPEIMAISDRILVMKLGKVSALFDNNKGITQEILLKAASPD